MISLYLYNFHNAVAVTNPDLSNLVLCATLQMLRMLYLQIIHIFAKENFYIEAFKYDYTESSTEPKVSKLNFDLEDFNENNFYYYFDIVLDNDGIDKLVDYEELAGPEFIIDEDEC